MAHVKKLAAGASGQTHQIGPAANSTWIGSAVTRETANDSISKDQSGDAARSGDPRNRDRWMWWQWIVRYVKPVQFDAGNAYAG